MDRHPRGFSLIEAMIVVAIVGIIAVLAVPNLLGMMRKQRLSAQGDTTAAFVDATRRRAVGEGRCTRIILAASGKLTSQDRTTADCVNLDNANWVDVQQLIVDNAQMSFTLASLTNPGVAPAANFNVVFRPNGRLVGDGNLAVSTSDDGARVTVSDALLTNETRTVLVTSNGRICSLVAPNPPPALAAPVVCP